MTRPQPPKRIKKVKAWAVLNKNGGLANYNDWYKTHKHIILDAYLDNQMGSYTPKIRARAQNLYMGYKLQNELRDAGYNGAFLLEELIEACGDGFGSLEFMVFVKEWAAFVRSKDESYGGSTPTEAVARLWLALNKNAPK